MFSLLLWYCYLKVVLNKDIWPNEYYYVLLKQVGYYFAPSGKPYPDNWIITDVIYEYEGTLLSRQVSSNFSLMRVILVISSL